MFDFEKLEVYNVIRKLNSDVYSLLNKDKLNVIGLSSSFSRLAMKAISTSLLIEDSSGIGC